MSLLQINGVLWAQEIGSGLEWKVAGDVPVLFQSYMPDFWIPMSQTRPDGFTHANNLTSQLLLFFYAYGFFHFSINTSLTKPPLKWLFLIAFSCALSAGKVIVLGILMINAFAWLFMRTDNIHQLLRILAVTLAAYLLYFALFPALFILNFNLDVLIINIMGRVMNIQYMHDAIMLQAFYDFLTGLLSNNYQPSDIAYFNNYFQENFSIDPVSGLSSLIDYWMTLVMGIIIIGPIWLRWLRRLRRFDNPYIRNIGYLMVIMLISLIASMFGGPFITTIWFVFFFSCVSFPFTSPYFSKHFYQSVFAR